MDGRGVINWAVSHFKILMIIFSAGSVTFIISTIIIYASASYSPSETLIDFNVAPFSSKITLDGNQMLQGISKVDAGTHHLAITAAGFKSKEYDIEIKSGQTNSITEYLLNSENGLEYYTNNDGEMDVLRASSDEAAKQFAAEFDRKFAIRTDTPFEVEYGDIGSYGMMTVTFGAGKSPCTKFLCLLVHDYESAESVQVLKNALRKRGYDYSDYEIIFSGEDEVEDAEEE